MRVLPKFAILAGVLAITTGGAHAQGWCVYYDAYTYTCGFTSYGQCMATASGGGGLCRPDPFARPAVRPLPRVERHAPRRHKRRHRH
jgi:hypothetical protein